MAKEDKAQKETVGRVMHEFKHGELESSRGGKVRNPRQAVAIALSEAGASNQESPEQNQHNLARTKRKERQGQTAQQEKEGKMGASDSRSRADLMAEARERGVRGRSGMTKEELRRALGH